MIERDLSKKLEKMFDAVKQYHGYIKRATPLGFRAQFKDDATAVAFSLEMMDLGAKVDVSGRNVSVTEEGVTAAQAIVERLVDFPRLMTTFDKFAGIMGGVRSYASRNPQGIVWRFKSGPTTKEFASYVQHYGLATDFLGNNSVMVMRP